MTILRGKVVYEHVLGGSHYSEGGGELDDILGCVWELIFPQA